MVQTKNVKKKNPTIYLKLNFTKKKSKKHALTGEHKLGDVGFDMQAGEQRQRTLT